MPQHRVLADGHQQVAAHVHCLAGPGERGEQVEPEAVDVHLGHPVAQRVEDHPQRERMAGVDGVAAAGHVPVGVLEAPSSAGRVGDPVVDLVVQPAEAQRRPGDAGLGRVVVDDVEDAPRGPASWKALTIALNSVTCSPRSPLEEYAAWGAKKPIEL